MFKIARAERKIPKKKTSILHKIVIYFSFKSVFHCAAAKGQIKCLKSLCKKNSSIWLRNRRGDYPIHEAYYNRHIESVYYLLDVIGGGKRAAKSANMYDGRTLLHLAAADNDLKLCKRLVADGLDPNCLMKTSTVGFFFIILNNFSVFLSGFDGLAKNLEHLYLFEKKSCFLIFAPNRYLVPGKKRQKKHMLYNSSRAIRITII
jgi:hypothetical protein